jgi:hypothetical protein
MEGKSVGSYPNILHGGAGNFLVAKLPEQTSSSQSGINYGTGY